MLLNYLSKEEKFYFIDLLSKVFVADGPVNDFEKQFLGMYRIEMGDDINKYRRSSLTFEKLLEYFSTKPKTIKNLVYYNIVWVSISDEFYSVEIHLILDQIQHEFGITNKKKIELLKVVYTERDIKEKVKRLISE